MTVPVPDKSREHLWQIANLYLEEEESNKQCQIDKEKRKLKKAYGGKI